MTKRSLFYGLFVVFLAIEMTGSEVYRPYIWANNINDFGMADSYTNFIGIMMASFLFMGHNNDSEKKKDIRCIIETFMAFIVYEFIQLTLPWGTFDWKDIIATVFGGALTLIIYEASTLFIKVRQTEI